MEKISSLEDTFICKRIIVYKIPNMYRFIFKMLRTTLKIKITIKPKKSKTVSTKEKVWRTIHSKINIMKCHEQS
jgi:hypothetical protein